MKANLRHPIPQPSLAGMIFEATKVVQNLQSVCARLVRAKRIARREGDDDNLGRASRALTLTKLMLHQKAAVLQAFECDAGGYVDHQDQESYTAHLYEQWREITDADTSSAEELLLEIG